MNVLGLRHGGEAGRKGKVRFSVRARLEGAGMGPKIQAPRISWETAVGERSAKF